MRPSWLLVLLCTLFGVLMTVIVAWGCALYAPSYPEPQTALDLGGYPANWPSEPWPIDHAGLPPAAFSVDGTRGVGFSHAFAVGSPRRDSLSLIEQESFRAGWPLHALAAWKISTYTPVAGTTQAISLGPLDGGIECPEWMPTPQWDRPACLPYRVLATGFALDVLIFATSLYVVSSGCMWLRGHRRRRRGRCVRCAHTLAGALVCPECGTIAGAD